MKRVIYVALMALIALSFISCDGLDKLLSVNLFDAPLKLSAGQLSSASLSELNALSEDPDFFTELSADPTLQATAIANLEGVIASGTPAEVQNASLLAAEITIYTTQAGTLVNTVVGALMGLAGSDDAPTQAQIVDSIIPPSLRNGDGSINEDEFVKAVDALIASAWYYEQLGASLGSGNYIDGENAGEIIQNAVISMLLKAIEPPSHDPPYSVGTYLLAVIAGTENPVDNVFSMPELGSDPPSPLDNILSLSPELKQLFSAMGGA